MLSNTTPFCRPSSTLLLCLVQGLVLSCILGLGFPAASAAEFETLTGRLDVAWGDPQPGSGLGGATALTLTDGSGSRHRLSISRELAERHGGFIAWNGRRVEVQVHLDEAFEVARPGVRRVAALTLLPSEGDDTGGGTEVLGGVTGSHPWVSLLCKFSDIPDEPQNLAFFQGMFGNEEGALDHYWREQSYDTIDIVGSTAIDWVDLPSPQSTYVPTPGSGTSANLNLVFDDCTAAADPFVDFSNGGSGFSGINLMLNGLLDCCAWGGGRFATLDGVSKVWRTTWDPPWAYAQVAIIAHEMGHGFGLPHSNNFDDDGNPYDSPWDVMSSATGYAVDDPTYGSTGKHHTAYHKNRLGWFGAGEVLEVQPGDVVTATIDAMALPSTENYRMARIPVLGSSTWYTVEVRDFLGYDGAIPGNAVIITHVDESRSEPAWAVDADVPPADYGDTAGTMFLPGESYIDPNSGITITVDFATAAGFDVTITSPSSLVFSDGFESGDVTLWSASVP